MFLVPPLARHPERSEGSASAFSTAGSLAFHHRYVPSLFSTVGFSLRGRNNSHTPPVLGSPLRARSVAFRTASQLICLGIPLSASDSHGTKPPRV